jgi:hypothetical protein
MFFATVAQYILNTILPKVLIIFLKAIFPSFKMINTLVFFTAKNVERESKSSVQEPVLVRVVVSHSFPRSDGE